ncbi:hypothetical protein [Desulfonatronovibrio magnus]|uniref:hypothetical protein n=1 Tax=Desulfonatronovibrio magnus TaxID=698827 RepID=UPI0005EAE7D1|nr:hypothetical protein [Desulfonatronovibrio magnus]
MSIEETHFQLLAGSVPGQPDEELASNWNRNDYQIKHLQISVYLLLFPGSSLGTPIFLWLQPHFEEAAGAARTKGGGGFQPPGIK